MEKWQDVESAERFVEDETTQAMRVLEHHVLALVGISQLITALLNATTG